MPGATPTTPGATPATGPATSTATPPGSGAERWRATAQAVVQKYGPQMGINTPQGVQNWTNAMVKQIGSESSGDPGAVNNSDSNAIAGHPSQGLLQFIPSTFQSHNISGGSFMDPQSQMAAFMDYVYKTYGTGGSNSTGGGGQGDPNGVPNYVGFGHGY